MTGDEREEGKSDAPAGREATNPSDNRGNIMQKLVLTKRFKQFTISKECLLVLIHKSAAVPNLISSRANLSHRFFEENKLNYSC